MVSNNMSMNIIGINTTKIFLLGKKGNSSKAAEEAIKKAGFFIQAEVVESIAGHRAEHVSVDTGYFMDSILSVFPTSLSANISCNKYPVNYANNREYNPNIISGPRKHFVNTKERNEKKIHEFFNSEIKTI